jgi:hypothetical protein
MAERLKKHISLWPEDILTPAPLATPTERLPIWREQPRRAGAGELDTLTCQPSEVRFPLRDTLNGGLPMKSSTFTTQNLKPSDQLQSWQEWFFPAFDITPLDLDDPFEAQNSLWKLGDLIVSRVLAPSVHVKRTKANVKKAAGEGNASSFAHFCKL